MSKRLISLSLLMTISLLAPANGAQQPSQTPARMAAPAPPRDLTGVWAGSAVMQLEPVPEMTPLGQKLFDEAKPLYGPSALAVADSNDPLVTCDPLGFPRNVFYELRGVEFSHGRNKVVQLFQYQRVWREIWTDGRKLPADVGGTSANAPDARWYGYSVGRWADDYTFVVETTGFNEKAWSDQFGHPRSLNAHVEERYHRIDHDTLELTVTVNDPKIYTKSFVGMKQILRWNPTQELEEQFCVPSEAAEYLSIFKPAAAPK